MNGQAGPICVVTVPPRSPCEYVGLVVGKDFMKMSDLVDTEDRSTPFQVLMVEGRFALSEQCVVDSSELYALIITAPRRWRWSGSQMTRLQPKDRSGNEVHIFLCNSGRFTISYAQSEMIDGEPVVGFWRLTEPEKLKEGRSAELDWSTSGGQPFEVPGAVTVSRETAWQAIGGMYLYGGRDTSLNWQPAEELEYLFDEDVGFP